LKLGSPVGDPDAAHFGENKEVETKKKRKGRRRTPFGLDMAEAVLDFAVKNGKSFLSRGRDKAVERERESDLVSKVRIACGYGFMEYLLFLR
jgi:hypothetical protein